MIEEAPPQFCWQKCVRSTAQGFVGSTVPGSAALPRYRPVPTLFTSGSVLLAVLAHTVIAREQTQVGLMSPWSPAVPQFGQWVISRSD